MINKTAFLGCDVKDAFVMVVFPTYTLCILRFFYDQQYKMFNDSLPDLNRYTDRETHKRVIEGILHRKRRADIICVIRNIKRK